MRPLRDDGLTAAPAIGREALHRAAAIPAAFIALCFAGVAELIWSFGISLWHQLAAVTFLCTSSASCAVVACQIFLKRAPTSIALLVGGFGHCIAALLLSVAVVLEEVSPLWAFAVVLAVCLGIGQLRGVRSRRTPTCE